MKPTPTNRRSILVYSALETGRWDDVMHVGADLVAFDPATVRDLAGYDNPLVAPAGIERVWVAGECVARAGVVTGNLPGVLLRRTR